MTDSSADYSPSDVLTSREAAQVCGVNFRTVIRWIERGELAAYRLPGRGDYRISLMNLRAFMHKHGIPEKPNDARMNRILIVDDELSMARAIERTLRRQGYETQIASDGFQAGSMLHTFMPGLMTLDLRMSGLDGFGVLQFLRETNQLGVFKVLVISGESGSRLQQALDQGAHAILAKPFANAQLVAAVQKLLTGQDV